MNIIAKYGTALMGVLSCVLLQPSWADDFDCQDARAAPLNNNTPYYEGFYVGESGCLYDPASINVEQVPPFLGPSGDTGRRLYFVNGANPERRRESSKLALLAEFADIPVVGIYNTFAGGQLEGLIESARPQIRGASKQIAELALAAIDRKEIFHIRGGSHGTAVISDGMGLIRDALSERLRNRPEINRVMAEFLRVETHGSTVRSFPDGPQYIHYVNLLDPVPFTAGVMAVGNRPGRQAVIALFSDTIEAMEAWFMELPGFSQFLLQTHGFCAYTVYREPFDALYGEANQRRRATRIWLPQKTETIQRPGDL